MKVEFCNFSGYKIYPGKVRNPPRLPLVWPAAGSRSRSPPTRARSGRPAGPATSECADPALFLPSQQGKLYIRSDSKIFRCALVSTRLASLRSRELTRSPTPSASLLPSSSAVLVHLRSPHYLRHTHVTLHCPLPSTASTRACLPRPRRYRCPTSHPTRNLPRLPRAAHTKRHHCTCHLLSRDPPHAPLAACAVAAPTAS